MPSKHGSPANLLRLMQEHDQWSVYCSNTTACLTGATCVWNKSLPPGRRLFPANALLVCAVPPQLLPRLLQAQQFKCPHCRTTQGLPEGLGMQQEAQLMSAAPERVRICCLL